MGTKVTNLLDGDGVRLTSAALGRQLLSSLGWRGGKGYRPAEDTTGLGP